MRMCNYILDEQGDRKEVGRQVRHRNEQMGRRNHRDMGRGRTHAGTESFEVHPYLAGLSGSDDSLKRDECNRDLLVGIEDLSPCGANGKLQQPSSKDK